MREIASRANVSVSTVSKALSNSPEISRATADRVIKASRELHYVCGKDDAGIISRTARTIGVIGPEAISSYYSVLVHNIIDILFQNGYRALVGFSNLSPDEEVKLLHMFAEKGVDGIIMIRMGGEYTTIELEKFKKETDILVTQIILQIEGSNISAAYDGFIVDEEHGIYHALKHFRDLGHERIFFVGEERSKLRGKFFLNALRRLGLNAGDDNVFIGEEKFELGGYLRMKEVLQRPDLSSAIFAAYDNVAIGAMRAIKEAGLEIPADISIISYDDIQIARYLQTSLTTVGVPFEKLARISAESLLNRLKTGDMSSATHSTLKPDLYIRESTGLVKK